MSDSANEVENNAEADYDFHPDDMPEVPVLPLDAWHRAQGARMVPFAGYEMPIQYTGEGGGIVAEHDWTRESASLFDVSHMGQLTLHGEDAAAELEKLLPGNIANLKPGKMRYSLLLNDQGGVIDDLMVTNTGGQIALVVNGACKWDDIAHLREHLPDSITLNHHENQALLALQGPKAGEVLATLLPSTAELTFMSAGYYEWNGMPLWVSRAGYTGEDGFEISVRDKDVAKLADALVADDRVRPAGLGARDSLRLEAGLPLYGHDLDTETDPVSAELMFALTKNRRETGGWMGHEALVAKMSGGSDTRRVGLVLEGRLPAREGSLVFAQVDGRDTQVGRVTSGGFSPTLGHPVAMAYIAADHAALDTKLQVEVRKKRLDAVVAPMPFVPHKYYRGG